MIGRDERNGAPVELFRKRLFCTLCPKARFNVRHGNPQIKGGQGRTEGRGCISLHDNERWFDFSKELLRFFENSASNIEEVLIIFHDLKIKIGPYLKERKKTLQQLRVLPCR